MEYITSLTTRMIPCCYSCTGLQLRKWHPLLSSLSMSGSSKRCSHAEKVKFPFTLSFTRLYEYHLRRKFLSHGLCQQVFQIDDATIVSAWVPATDSKCKDSVPLRSHKRAILLLHGFGASAVWQWSGQLSQLTPHCQVYIPDLVFFGGSHSSSGERSEIFQAECMLKLMAQLGVQTFDVVGISYGGFIAYRMATMQPIRVTRVVLTDCGLLMTPKELADMLLRWQVADAAELLLPTSTEGVSRLIQLAYYNPIPVPSIFLKDTLKVMFSDMVQEKRELLENLVKLVDDTDTSKLPLLTQPTLLVWGEEDEVFPLQIGERMQKYFGGETKLVVIKKASHMCNAQRVKEYNEVLSMFLLK